jgi:hypothetical protein
MNVNASEFMTASKPEVHAHVMQHDMETMAAPSENCGARTGRASRGVARSGAARTARRAPARVAAPAGAVARAPSRYGAASRP